MANVNLRLFLILAMITGLNTQLKIGSSGATAKCPKVISLKDFDIQRFSGAWYDIASVPMKGLPAPQCAYGNYTLDSPTKGRIFGSAVINEKVQKVNQTFTAKDSSGNWQVQIPAISVSFSLGIINTDYDNFAVVYGCATMGALKFESSSILSRTNTLDQSFINSAVALLKSQNLPSQVSTVKQTNCINRV